MKHIFKKDLLDLGGMFIHPLAKQLNGSVKFFEFGAHATIHINIPFQQVNKEQERELSREVLEKLSKNAKDQKDSSIMINKRKMSIDFYNIPLTFAKNAISNLKYKWEKPSRQKIKQIQKQQKQKKKKSQNNVNCLENVIGKSMGVLGYHFQEEAASDQNLSIPSYEKRDLQDMLKDIRKH